MSQELKELTEGIQEFQEKTFESLYSKKVLWSSDRSKSNSGDDESIQSDVVASATVNIVSTPTEESVPVPAVAPVAEPVSEPASAPVLTTDVASVKNVDPSAMAKESVKEKAPPVPVITKGIASKEILSEASVSSTFANVVTAGSAGGTESDVSVLLKDVPVDTTESVDPDVEKLQILKAQQTISKSFLSLSEDEEEEGTVMEARVAPAARISSSSSSSSSSAKQSSVLDSIFDIFKSDVTTAKKDAPKDKVVDKVTTTSTVTQQPVVVEVPPTTTVVVPPPVVIKKPTVAPSPAIPSPLLSGLFGFLSPSPGFQGSATPTKKTTAVPPKPSVSVPELEEDSPTILPPQEEAFAKKKVDLVAPPPRVKATDSSTAAVKAKGLFGFLGDASEDFFEDDPTSTSRKAKKLSVVSAVVVDADESVEAPPTAVKSVETKSSSGGLFGFLSPPSTAPIKKRSVVSEIEKKKEEQPVAVVPVVPDVVDIAAKVVAPPAVKQASLKVAVKTVVKDVNKEAKTSSGGGGGLFGFFNLSPAPIKKPVVVVPEVKATTPPPPPAVEAKPRAAAFSPAVKVSNPLNAKPAAPKSVAISPVAKLVLPPVVKQVAPKVVVKDVNKAVAKEEVESSVSAKASSSSSGVGGGFFGFLNLPPAAAPVKKSEAPPQINTSPVAAARPAVSKPVVAAPAVAPTQQKPQEKAKPLNLFGFLDSSENFFEDQPISSLPPASNAKGPASPLPPKVESPVAAKASSSSSGVGGGFFGFLNLPPNAAPVKKSVAPAAASKVSPPVVKQVTPIVKKELVAAPIIKKEAAKTSSGGGGGLFGFLNPAPAPIKKPVVAVPEVKATSSPPAAEGKKTNPLNARPASPKIGAVPATKIVPAPVVKSTAVVAAKTGSSSSGGGLFGFFNPSPSVPVKKPIVEPPAVPTTSPLTKVTNPLNAKPKSNAVPAVKTAIAKVIAEKAPAKELVAAPIIKKEAAKTSSGGGGGGLFGFLNPPPAPIKKPVVAVPPAVEAKKTNPLNARPASTKVVIPPPVTKATPSSMDKSFQLSVSKLLKGDTKKIMLFQKATDSFRSGGVSATDYIVSLDKLFGSDVVGASIIPPLIAQLPEKDRATELRKAYEQTRKTGGSSSKDKKTTK